jgi:hypothetical protein
VSALSDLTRGQRTILKTLGMRELNRRKDPMLLPKNPAERKPYEALENAALVTVHESVITLTEAGRELSLVLMR